MKSMHVFFSSSSISATSNSTGNSLDEIYMMGPPAEPPPQPTHHLLEPRRLPSSQFKGVVPQPNGRWGAQIYEKHQRVWLGTFNSEVDAARAYDVAAQRFRGRDAATNFAPLPPSSPELRFIHSHSKAEIVDMLRKHTYHDELLQGLRTCRPAPWGMGGSAPPQREHLFDKAVTPSDVGKLNRLVIPKQHAEKHFPSPGGTGDGKGVLLNLEDARGKVWRFRYSYWNSSQSYVLTKGWSRYVKEMGLKAGDIVTFHRSRGADTQLYIDWRAGGDGNESASSSAGGGAYGYRPVRLFGVNIGD